MQTIKDKKNIQFKDNNNNTIVIIENPPIQTKGLTMLDNSLGYNYHEGVKVYPTPNKYVGVVTLLLHPILITFEDNTKGIPLNKCLIGYYKKEGKIYGLIDTVQKAYNHNTRLSWTNLYGRARIQPNTNKEEFKDIRLDYNKGIRTSGLLKYINSL